jgi:hypothetical protein
MVQRCLAEECLALDNNLAMFSPRFTQSVGGLRALRALMKATPISVSPIYSIDCQSGASGANYSGLMVKRPLRRDGPPVIASSARRKSQGIAISVNPILPQNSGCWNVQPSPGSGGTSSRIARTNRPQVRATRSHHAMRGNMACPQRLSSLSHLFSV